MRELSIWYWELRADSSTSCHDVNKTKCCKNVQPHSSKQPYCTFKWCSNAPMSSTSVVQQKHQWFGWLWPANFIYQNSQTLSQLLHIKGDKCIIRSFYVASHLSCELWRWFYRLLVFLIFSKLRASTYLKKWSQGFWRSPAHLQAYYWKWS